MFTRSAHNLLSTLACFEDELVGKIVNFSLSFPTPHETYRQLNKSTLFFYVYFPNFIVFVHKNQRALLPSGVTTENLQREKKKGIKPSFRNQ